MAAVNDFDVFVSDKGEIADKYKEMLKNYNVLYEEKQHTEDLILNASEIIKSPGIPETAPIVVKARELGIPVISEIEFAARYTNAIKICITGSNGKTTTTKLIYHILQKAGLNVGLAGNVGQSFAYQVATKEYDYYVIELSSFQLDNMYKFKSDLSVLMNITPDHLDRYDHKMENYVAAKFRIMRNQGPDDVFIYWQDDPIISEQLRHMHTEAQMMPFSAEHSDGCTAWVKDGEMSINVDGEQWTMPTGELAIQGLHNLYNSMAASISASVLHIQKDVIRHALGDFQAVEHRLEYVRTLDGVRWINDSKATNVNSTWYALESMRDPVVLILGGKDKGNDYSEIEPFVREKVKAIVCLGVDNRKLHAFFDGKVPVVTDAGSMAECVTKCHELAQSGDTVLLSPCCASFDLFKSYEDRGTQFKQEVNSL